MGFERRLKLLELRLRAGDPADVRLTHQPGNNDRQREQDEDDHEQGLEEARPEPPRRHAAGLIAERRILPGESSGYFGEDSSVTRRPGASLSSLELTLTLSCSTSRWAIRLSGVAVYSIPP